MNSTEQKSLQTKRKTMNKNLILSVILCLVFAGGAFAQSGGRSGGSSARSYSGGSDSRTSKADKELASAKKKLVRQMTRRDFQAVKLNKDQKQSLTSMVDSKYPEMVRLDKQIANAIPEDQVKSLQRAFRNAKKDGSSEVEAMSMSMGKIGLPEMVQEKVLMMNQSKEEIRESILISIVETFDQEQQDAFLASMEAKEMEAKKEMMGEEEMADKKMDGDKEMMDEEMTDKTMDGDGEKEAMSDKEMAGEKEAMTDKEMMSKEMASAK